MTRPTSQRLVTEQALDAALAGLSTGGGGSGGSGASVITAKPVTDTPDTYPLGLSMFAAASDSSWPTNLGTVVTNTVSGYRTSQVIYEKDTANVWTRVGVGSSGTYSWSAWKQTSFVGHTHAASDITSGTLAIAQGGTGNATGLSATATALATGRTVQTNLASTTTATFNGTANITPGVTGTLPLSNGGTGSTTASGALAQIGAAAASHTHIPSAIVAGVDGQVLTTVGGTTAWSAIAGTTYDGTFNVLDYGSAGDTKTVTDASASAGSATVTSASAGFTSTDVGKRVVIGGTYTTIKTVNSVTSITLNANVVASTAVFQDGTAPVTGAPLTILTYGTDDAPGFNAALDAAYNAGGGVVIIPGGRTYFSTGPIKIKSYTRLMAHGATIKKALPNSILGGSQKYWDSTSTNHPDNVSYSDGYPYVVVDGGTWDQMGQNATAGSNGWTFAHTHDVEVRNAVIRNVAGAHGIEFDGVQVGRVFNTAFHGYRNVPLAGLTAPGGVDRSVAESIQIDYGSYPTDTQICDTITIDGCTFDKSGDTGLPGRAVGSHSLNTTMISAHKNITVVNCHVFGALNQGIRFLQYNNGIIANNIVENTGADGIRVEDWGTSHAYAGPTSRQIVANNIVISPDGHGIAIVGGDSSTVLSDANVTGNVIYNPTDMGIYVLNANQSVVAANTVSSSGSYGIELNTALQGTVSNNTVTGSGSSAIYLTASPEGTVIGNHITTTGGNGVFISGSSTDCNVVGNHIHGANGSGSAIQIAGSSNYCSVTMNQGRPGSSSAGWAAHANSGLYITSSVTGTVHFGNDMHGLANNDGGAGSVTSQLDR